MVELELPQAVWSILADYLWSQAEQDLNRLQASDADIDAMVNLRHIATDRAGKRPPMPTPDTDPDTAVYLECQAAQYWRYLRQARQDTLAKARKILDMADDDEETETAKKARDVIKTMQAELEQIDRELEEVL